MPKTILITGATDGIGLETAQRLSALGHHLLIHGRNADKLSATAGKLRALPGSGVVETFLADLSDLTEVARLGRTLRDGHDRIDVLINNAGVFKVDNPTMADGQDVRFVVNTLAPALLTRLVLPVMPTDGRIVHLSSAAQAPVDLAALDGQRKLDAMDAYAQSKLALTMWSKALSADLGQDGPVTVAVNPGSLLATKMVRKGFGVAGNDIGIGADILIRAALSDEFSDASGLYFDNDSGRFATPHADGANPAKIAPVAKAIEARITPSYR
ncbi:Fatty acyl-CoA reductase [Thalassovita gelatinovora]|uniref:Fatty acyl-CoA reductase n=1 Tax=Thalassovita gelatinovora TaxID=53501 RepID=A0A0P1FHY4_THAGE|nr:SDR family NAD(P)-dependent oxidoreductase [Thalassovita gelatinovora]QIZ81991.1 SDR family NAD(P)-dependent oxidoreductase [Thalassovita gelatinovora]CUH67437.1 Fatty acyl-CoA reductase [Thalassovita gelatinovora]SEP74063.1 short chain dehydrogenase [Thalassovita gelatinovora]